MVDEYTSKGESQEGHRGPCGRPDEPCAVCRGISAVRVVTSEELLQGHRELFIVHKGQVYRLLQTRNDKLILQK